MDINSFHYTRLCVFLTDKDSGDVLRRVPVYAEAVFVQLKSNIETLSIRRPRLLQQRSRWETSTGQAIYSSYLASVQISGAVKDVIQAALEKYVHPRAVQGPSGADSLNQLVKAVISAAEEANIYLYSPQVAPSDAVALEEIVRLQTSQSGLDREPPDVEEDGAGDEDEGEDSGPTENEGNNGEEGSEVDTSGEDANARSPSLIVPLGLLATDHVGLVSYDLNDMLKQKSLIISSHQLRASFSTRYEVTLNIYPNLAQDNKVDVTNSAGLLKRGISGFGGAALVARIGLAKGEIVKMSHMALRLPSLQNASLIDWKVSPGSFASIPQSLIGSDGCETLTPATFAVSQYSIRQVFRVAKKPGAPSQNTNLPRALVHEYTLSFTPIGHSLGQILYTLPLAPGESVRLAVIDWRRQDTDKRTEDTVVTESLLHEQSRDRTVTETVTAVLNEWQRGGSLMGGLSGGAGASGTMGAYGVAGGAMLSIGGAMTTSSGTRNLAGKSMQNIVDNVHQASSSVRELHSTVVVQTDQKENQNIQTRVFANHNRGHTMTIIYYEVLRHFKVSVRFDRKYDAALLQRNRDAEDLSKLSGVSADWASLLLSLEPMLRPVLLDRSLDGAFEAIHRYQALLSDPNAVKINWKLDLTDGTRNVPEEETHYPSLITFERFWWTIAMGDASPNNIHIYYVEKGQPGKKLKLGGSEAMNESQIFNTSDWVSFVTDPLDTPVQWGKLLFFTIAKNDSNAVTFNSITVEGISTNGNRYLLHTSPQGRAWKLEYNNSSVALQVERPGPPLATSRPEQGLSKEDYALMVRLNQHLVRHAGHYNMALESQRTSREWAVDFENMDWQTGTSPAGPKLTDVLSPTPLGVYGNKIAFALLEPWESNATPGSEEEAPSTPEPTNPDAPDMQIGETLDHLISLPTRGVFAEAKLGHCNVAEEIDDTRFWKWNDHPLPLVAPEIAPTVPVQPAARDPSTSVQPTNFPANIVNIQQPTALPDPVGLSAAMQVLRTPNIFRDMSASEEVQKLLSDLAKGAVDMAKAAGMAKDIQNKYDLDSKKANNSRDLGIMGALNERDLGMAKINADDRREAAEKVTPAQAQHANKVTENAKRAGLITDEKAKELTEKQLGNVVGNSKPAPKPKARTFILSIKGKTGAMASRIQWALRTAGEDFGGREENTTSEFNTITIRVEPKIDDHRYRLTVHAAIFAQFSPLSTTWDVNNPPLSPAEAAKQQFVVDKSNIEINISEELSKRHDHHYVALVLGTRELNVRAQNTDEAMQKAAQNAGISVDFIKAAAFGISGEAGFSWEGGKTKTAEREIEMKVNIYDGTIGDTVEIT